MITIDNSVPETEKYILFGPNGRIGEIENSYGFCRVRLSIKQEKADGYYVEYNRMRYNISPEGRVLDGQRIL